MTRFGVRFLMTVICLLGPVAAMALVIPFGEAPGQLGFLNEKNHPEYIAIPLPLGPSAFRVAGDRVFVFDGMHSRILGFGADGSLQTTVPVPATNKTPWFGDFALQKDSGGNVQSFWVLDRLDQAVVQVDPTGRVLCRVGGVETASCPFKIIHRIEVGPSGRVYVADEGWEKIFVLRGDGAIMKEIPATGSGFLLDGSETLHRLDWKEETGEVVLQRQRLDGTAEPPRPLSLKVPFRPEIWFALPSGDLCLSYFSREPFEGPRKLTWVKPDGSVHGILDVEVPEGMIRFFEPAGADAIWRARGDFSKAPEGKLVIDRLSLAGEPEG